MWRVLGLVGVGVLLARRLFIGFRACEPNQPTDHYSEIRIRRVVLDVGSGHRPHPRANVWADVHTDHTGVPSQPIQINGRPFVCCDVQHLPFKTQRLDYVYCQHVLEHVGDPPQARAELHRVAAHGQITYPSRWWERLMNAEDPAHRWQASNAGFIPNPTGGVLKRTIGRVRHGPGKAVRRKLLLWLFGPVRETKEVW